MTDVDNVAKMLRAYQLGLDPTVPGWEAEALSRLETLFREQGNAITPWFALRWAMDNGLPVPRWVLESFYRYGGYINDIANAGSRGEAAAVGRALGFGGEGAGSIAAAAAARKDARDWEVAVVVAIELRQGHPMEAALQAAKDRTGVSVSTARRCHANHGLGAQETVDKLLIALDCQQ